MIYLRGLLLLFLCVSGVVYAKPPLNVFACEPEWAALANVIGGNKVNIYSATTAQQDPHHIQARPSLIAKVRRADILVCSGAELEIGWLPLLLKKSANKRIQKNTTGYFMAAEQVPLLGKLTTVDRSMGDVHAMGNPHVQLSPILLKKIAAALAERLALIDPVNQSFYLANAQQFSKSLSAALKQWQPKINKLKGKKIIVHHDNWLYLAKWLDLDVVASLEPKPGLPPSTKHLSKVKNIAKKSAIAFIMHSSYQDKKASRWLSKQTNIPVVGVSSSVVDWKKPHALIHWMENMLDVMTQALNK